MLSGEEVKTLRKQIHTEENALPGVFSALSDASRFHIFQLLLREKGLCVTDIANVLEISVPAASQQLKILEMSGLVKRDRHGQMICYQVKAQEPLVKAVIRIVSGLSALTGHKYR